jgi:hypothetical protein
VLNLKNNFGKKLGAQKIHSIGQAALFLANPDDPQFDFNFVIQ